MSGEGPCSLDREWGKLARAFGATPIADGRTQAEDDEQLCRQARLMQQHLDFANKRVLELGCRDGRHSILAAEMGASECLAVDARSAAFPHHDVAHPQVHYLCADVRLMDLRAHGSFDAILCFGLLYHLPDPFALIEQMAASNVRTIVISTHCGFTAARHPRGYWGQWIRDGLNETDGMEDAMAFRPTKYELIHALEDAGLTVVVCRDYYTGGGEGVFVVAQNDR